MQKLTLFLFMLCQLGSLIGQEENCITIDFEPTADFSPVEGSILSDQYFDEFGVTFSTNAPNFPTIAQIGAPVIGFGSNWGDDTPRPGVDIGQFFLTDDGIFSGLIGQPLIINFDRPVYFAEGCIIDIDLSEIFTITARNEDETTLFTTTISTGDPIAGDGALSCWQFENDNCLGIHSIVIQGTRTQSGIFGFGYDNFQFCYIIPRSEIIQEDATCRENNGSAQIITNNEFNLNTYSFNGVNFLDDTLFTDLAPGNYQLFINNDAGCNDSIPVSIDSIRPAEINAIQTQPVSCELDNGSIEVIAASGSNLSYSIDGINFQASPIFNDLSEGQYLIIVEDEHNCTDTASAELASIPLFIESIESTPDECGEAIGSLSITASGGAGLLFYSIDQTNFSFSPQFNNLIHGEYIVTVQDEAGCQVMDTIEIDGSLPILFLEVASHFSDCGFANGELSITLADDQDNLGVYINNIPTDNSLIYSDLDVGDYIISIFNPDGCQNDTLISIGQNDCPLYVPDAFTPTGDGTNDLFRIYPHPDFIGIINDLDIFNRWGDLVYTSRDYNPKLDGWDGTFKGEEAPVGVYVYQFTATYPSGKRFFKGDVTLLR